MPPTTISTNNNDNYINDAHVAPETIVNSDSTPMLAASMNLLQLNKEQNTGLTRTAQNADNIACINNVTTVNQRASISNDNPVWQRPARTVWKINDGETLIYKKPNGMWVEYENDDRKITHTYRQISDQDDEITLFDIDRKFFLKLTADFVYFGRAPTKVETVFNDGTWVEFRLWKVKDQDIYFHKIDNQFWTRVVNDVQEAIFQFEATEGYEVVLHDVIENVYYKLDAQEVRCGPSRDDCTAILFKGAWVIEPPF